MQEPELELKNLQEIETLLASDLESKRQDGIGKALQGITLGIVHLRLTVYDLRQTLSEVSNKLEFLNKNLIEADKSSSKLTQALNTITLAGVIVAGIGILIMIGNLALDLYKTFLSR